MFHQRLSNEHDQCIKKFETDLNFSNPYFIVLCNKDHSWKLKNITIGSILHHKIAKWIVIFNQELTGLISRSWLFKASHANANWPSHCYSWMYLLFLKWESTAREVHPFFFPGKTVHCYTFTSHLYISTSINNALFTIESWCCHHVVFRSDLHGSDWSKWLWPISNVQLFIDL